MKVCIVSLNITPYFAGASFGGAETQAAFIAEALGTQGIDVEFVAADVDGNVQFPVPVHNAYRSSAGIPWVRFLHPRLTGIVSALNRADADVYYQRNAGMVTGVTAWFCLRHGKPFVYGAGADSDFSMSDVIISGVRDKRMYEFGLRRADGIIVQNETQAKACKEMLGVTATKIPNGIALSEQRETERDGSVVWVGALRDVKRPELFLDLAEQIPDRRFVIVGGAVPSQPEYAKRMLKRAEALPNVEATGRVSIERAGEYLGRAALLVNTSYYEGFPNVFLEAWVRGTPVASIVDIGSVIEDEDVGVVAGSFDGLRNAVKALLENDARRTEMGSRARRLIEVHHSPEALGPLYAEYFERVRRAKTP